MWYMNELLKNEVFLDDSRFSGRQILSLFEWALGQFIWAQTASVHRSRTRTDSRARRQSILILSNLLSIYFFIRLDLQSVQL